MMEMNGGAARSQPGRAGGGVKAVAEAAVMFPSSHSSFIRAFLRISSF